MPPTDEERDADRRNFRALAFIAVWYLRCKQAATGTHRFPSWPEIVREVDDMADAFFQPAPVAGPGESPR